MLLPRFCKVAHHLTKWVFASFIFKGGLWSFKSKVLFLEWTFLMMFSLRKLLYNSIIKPLWWIGFWIRSSYFGHMRCCCFWFCIMDFLNHCWGNIFIFWSLGSIVNGTIELDCCAGKFWGFKHLCPTYT